MICLHCKKKIILHPKTRKQIYCSIDCYVASGRKKAVAEKYKKSEKYKLSQKKYRQSIKNKMCQQRYNQSEKGKKIRSRNNSKYTMKKRKLCPIFKLRHTLGNSVLKYLKYKKIKKENSTFKIVGCTPQFLKNYLENKFLQGMTWDNHGIRGWHIDHIIPLSSAKTKKKLYQLMHYTNLQPLWAGDNIRKGAKLNYEVE